MLHNQLQLRDFQKVNKVEDKLGLSYAIVQIIKILLTAKLLNETHNAMGETKNKFSKQEKENL